MRDKIMDMQIYSPFQILLEDIRDKNLSMHGLKLWFILYLEIAWAYMSALGLDQAALSHWFKTSIRPISVPTILCASS